MFSDSCCLLEMLGQEQKQPLFIIYILQSIIWERVKESCLMPFDHFCSASTSYQVLSEHLLILPVLILLMLGYKHLLGYFPYQFKTLKIRIENPEDLRWFGY